MKILVLRTLFFCSVSMYAEDPFSSSSYHERSRDSEAIQREMYRQVIPRLEEASIVRISTLFSMVDLYTNSGLESVITSSWPRFDEFYSAPLVKLLPQHLGELRVMSFATLNGSSDVLELLSGAVSSNRANDPVFDSFPMVIVEFFDESECFAICIVSIPFYGALDFFMIDEEPSKFSFRRDLDPNFYQSLVELIGSNLKIDRYFGLKEQVTHQKRLWRGLNGTAKGSGLKD